MKDLVVLVADKNMEFLFKGLLPRIPLVEGINAFSYDIVIHTNRDPGILTESHDFLRPFSDKYGYAIVVLDHTGCGKEDYDAIDLEHEIEARLSQSGWGDRVAAIMISPELENWVWVNQVRIQEAISWEETTNIYDWLHENNWKSPDKNKPHQPKEAFEACLRTSKTPRSSSIYYEIANRSSYSQCQDRAFNKLKKQLKSWFSN